MIRPWTVHFYLDALRASIILGFLRHGQEGLNNAQDGGNSRILKLFPPGALFNATCIRLSLGRLLPSRACLRFTGS